MDSYIHSPLKQEHREILKSVLQSKVGNKKVLTMAGLVGKDAKMFAGQNATIFSVERNKEVYKRQSAELSQYPVVCWNTEILDFVSDPIIKKTKFDLICLDYCGPYTAKNEKTITEIFKSGLIKKGGYMSLTLSLCRDGRENTIKNTKLVEQTCCGNLFYYKENKVGTIVSTVQSLAQDFGIAIKEDKRIIYRNPGSNTTMLFLLFHRS